MSKYFLIGSLLQKCKIENYHKILDIGPSKIFPNSSHYLKDINQLKDFKFLKEQNIKFDFTYIQGESFDNIKTDDFSNILKDVNKLSKCGCIETLSPTKSLFFKKNKFIIWTDYHSNRLNVLPVDSQHHDQQLYLYITNNYTNTQLFYHNFYLWNLTTNNFIEYNILLPQTKEDYLKFLRIGINQSIKNTEILMNIL